MTDTAFSVSLAFVALCALSLLPLIIWIGIGRANAQTLHGDGNNPALRRRIGIHRNLLENAPITALAIVAGEYLGFAQHWLWLAVASFLIGRVMHAASYDSQKRGFSMLFTAGPAFCLGVAIVLHLFV